MRMEMFALICTHTHRQADTISECVCVCVCEQYTQCMRVRSHACVWCFDVVVSHRAEWRLLLSSSFVVYSHTRKYTHIHKYTHARTENATDLGTCSANLYRVWHYFVVDLSVERTHNHCARVPPSPMRGVLMLYC